MVQENSPDIVRNEIKTLIPEKPGTAPNYYCTWAVQNYMYGQGFRELDAKILEGGEGNRIARAQLIEENVFGKQGWSTTFYPQLRKDLFFLFDHGMYSRGNASMIVDTEKFPSFKSSKPKDCLKKIDDRIRANGWRGLALWIRGTPGGDRDVPLLEWSKYAGIKYWKVDGGDMDFNLIKLAEKIYPDLTLEHIKGEGPLNGNWTKDGRFGKQDWNSIRVHILRNTDVYRTYDVTPILSLATTVDRVAEMLKGVEGHPEVKGLLNVEDEEYVAAVLGCTMGIFRHPLIGLRPKPDFDLFFNGPRQHKRRIDEVVRAVMWQRIAQPYGAGVGFIKLDEDILNDEWFFERGQTWFSQGIGKHVVQGAPARIARNLQLPEVDIEGEKPFVLAGRFPNGAVAIAAQGRTKTDNGWFSPEADVTLNVEDAKGPFGIFGNYRSLTLVFAKPLDKVKILGQDLAEDKAIDITKQVEIDGNKLLMSGKLIKRIGLANASKGDLSDPGLVIAVKATP